jgi:hypothetical protein
MPITYIHKKENQQRIGFLLTLVFCRKITGSVSLAGSQSKKKMLKPYFIWKSHGKKTTTYTPI